MLALLRSGISKQEQFLADAAANVQEVETNDVRNYISPAESSVLTWISVPTPAAFGISYYSQGANLACLLDLSIHHDSAGKKGLDDVMRDLFRDFYLKGRGFSTEDLIAVINRESGSDYHDFFRRFVSGTEVPPYDTILGYAGYRLEKSTEKRLDTGWRLQEVADGAEVTFVRAGSSAAVAGLTQGDVITMVDGVPEKEVRRFRDKIGQTVKLTVKRRNAGLTLDMLVGSREVTVYRFVENGPVSDEHLKVRESWLKTESKASP